MIIGYYYIIADSGVDYSGIKLIGMLDKKNLILNKSKHIAFDVKNGDTRLFCIVTHWIPQNDITHEKCDFISLFSGT